MHARYADGRAAILHDAECHIGSDALTISVGETTHVWPYAELARTDDQNGVIAFKCKPDTGERITFGAEAGDTLKAAAPALFLPRAQGVESRWVVGSVVAGAWALAATFLFGVPMAAEPIAAIMPAAYRSQISDVSWSQINALTEYCDDAEEAETVLNRVADNMMARAGVTHRDQIWITIVNTDTQLPDTPFPNALALPDDSVIVTDDLIAMAEDPDEIIGVLAHEIAHVERNHVMKGVIRQIGAGIFFDVVVGGAGAGQAIAIASMNLSGLRYTRGDEEDADARGLDYLDAAGINTGGLATLFDRISELQQEAGEIPTMLSTHPATAARAAAARARARPGLAPSMSDADWQIVRRACGGAPAEPESQTPAPETPPAPQPAPQAADPATKPPEPVEGDKPL